MAPLGAVHLAGEEDPRADLLVQAGASSALQWVESSTHSPHSPEVLGPEA